VKPIEFYDLVESLCPAPRYADIFSRYRHNDKWDCHGDEAPVPTDDLSIPVVLQRGVAESNAATQTDEQFFLHLKGTAYRWRKYGSSLSSALIDSGDGPEPPPPTPENFKAAALKVWSRLSREDREALSAKFKHEEAVWSEWQRRRGAP
jgi:hypothetical protein